MGPLARTPPRPGPLALLLGLLLVASIVRAAWLSDDAFITLRTVDHFVHGRGLVWNLGERVQVYTHPLWMFAASALYAASHDAAVTLYALGGLATAGFLAVLLLGHGRRRDADGRARLGYGALVAVAAALGSKAFVEYSTSGLENPATHLLVAATWLVHLRAPRADGRTARRLAWVALGFALVALNRLDAVLLVAPAVAVDAWRALRTAGLARTLGALALGLLPLVLWELFSLVYYGFPVPNTAYAKLSTGLGRAWHLRQGGWFLAVTAWKDPVTVLVLVLGLGVALRARLYAVALALVLHVAYVVWVGGDFMIGRFLTPPFALALVVLARASWGGEQADASPRRAWVAPALAATLVLVGLASPSSPLRLWFGAGPQPFFEHGLSDERVVYAPYTAPFRDGAPRGSADAPAALRGAAAGAAIDPADPGSRYVAWETIGFFGFHAPPELYVIDPLALSAPLLAHLPVEDPATTRIGHFRRAAPAGFMRWLVADQDTHMDPDLARFAHALRLATSAPLLSRERLRAILSLHLGDARRGLEAYRERVLVPRE